MNRVSKDGRLSWFAYSTKPLSVPINHPSAQDASEGLAGEWHCSCVYACVWREVYAAAYVWACSAEYEDVVGFVFSIFWAQCRRALRVPLCFWERLVGLSFGWQPSVSLSLSVVVQFALMFGCDIIRQKLMRNINEVSEQVRVAALIIIHHVYSCYGYITLLFKSMGSVRC